MKNYITFSGKTQGLRAIFRSFSRKNTVSARKKPDLPRLLPAALRLPMTDAEEKPAKIAFLRRFPEITQRTEAKRIFGAYYPPTLRCAPVRDFQNSRRAPVREPSKATDQPRKDQKPEEQKYRRHSPPGKAARASGYIRPAFPKPRRYTGTHRGRKRPPPGEGGTVVPCSSRLSGRTRHMAGRGRATTKTDIGRKGGGPP